MGRVEPCDVSDYIFTIVLVLATGMCGFTVRRWCAQDGLSAIAIACICSMIMAFFLRIVINGFGSILFVLVGASEPWRVVLYLFAVSVPGVVVGCLLGTPRSAKRSNVHGDVVRCEACGYILRGLSEMRCPECGRAILYGATPPPEVMCVKKDTNPTSKDCD